MSRQGRSSSSSGKGRIESERQCLSFPHMELYRRLKGGLTIMIIGTHTVLDSRLPARALVVNAIETEVDDSSIVKRGRAQASVAWMDESLTDRREDSRAVKSSAKVRQLLPTTSESDEDHLFFSETDSHRCWCWCCLHLFWLLFYLLLQAHCIHHKFHSILMVNYFTQPFFKHSCKPGVGSSDAIKSERS